MSWFGAEHPYANQSPLLLTVRSGRSYHFMTTSQTMIPFVVLFMITLSSAVRFMVAALDKTVLMFEMPPYLHPSILVNLSDYQLDRDHIRAARLVPVSDRVVDPLLV